MFEVRMSEGLFGLLIQGSVVLMGRGVEKLK